MHVKALDGERPVQCLGAFGNEGWGGKPEIRRQAPPAFLSAHPMPKEQIVVFITSRQEGCSLCVFSLNRLYMPRAFASTADSTANSKSNARYHLPDRETTHLDGDAEERAVFLRDPRGDDAADGPASGEGHEDVVRGEEVGDLRRGPVEAVVDVVVAGREDVERQHEQEVAAGDSQQHSGCARARRVFQKEREGRRASVCPCCGDGGWSTSTKRMML